MQIQIINPLERPDWDDQLLAFENASVFHSAPWARVLAETYGYKPTYFTAVEDGRVKALIPVMEVRSFLTGKRGVSLPFTDFCEPLASSGPVLKELNEAVIRHGTAAGWRSMEWRGEAGLFRGEKSSCTFYRHELELPEAEGALAAGLRSSTIRNVRKAVKEGIEVNVLQSLGAVDEFYRLNCLTRKHHGIPPQPFRFFRKIHEHLISRDLGMVALGLWKKRVIAGCLFLHFGRSAIYKFGASDRRFQNLRANNLVMWEGLRYYQSRGIRDLSMGRSEPENKGLLQFKRGWNGREETLQYHRLDLQRKQYIDGVIGTGGGVTRLLRCTPIPLLRLIGAAVYRHVG